MTSHLYMFVVYRKPLDYPNGYVVRRWLIGNDGSVQPELEPIALVATLDDARSMIPAGLVNIGRQEDDEPHIVEVWL